MGKCIVTGAAGFIGSHLCQRLVELGYEVVGIDCLTDYYSVEIKKSNLKALGKSVKFIQEDLLNFDLKKLLEDGDYIFHLAAQPGVRASWGENFEIYTVQNILVTQKILEVLKEKNIEKIIYASTSSVYGDTKKEIMAESDALSPISPYGVTKLTAENLCYLYGKAYKVPYVILRYFTVFGPRQRPDMAFHKFILGILKDEPISIYGDGNQERDFTYISDIIEGTISAGFSPFFGEVFNLGGGMKISVNQSIKILEEISGKNAKIEYKSWQKGDMVWTLADTSKAKKMLGYSPKVSLFEGLKNQYEWMRDFYEIKTKKEE